MHISSHVHALKIDFVVPGPNGPIPRFVFVYLVLGERICLIDSGVAGSERVVFEELVRLGRRPEELSQLVLTHSHPDHVGAARAIRDATGCAVFAHESERNWIEDVELQARERPVPGFATLVGGSVPLSRTLSDGEVLELDRELRLEVLHTPGHSRGSLCLRLEPDLALFAGDALPLAGDMPIYDDPVAALGSLERLLAEPEPNYLLSAWDEPRSGASIGGLLRAGADYLRRVHAAVRAVACERPGLAPIELCREVVARLALPLFMVNPLVARSLQANLRALDDRVFSSGALPI